MGMKSTNFTRTFPDLWNIYFSTCHPLLLILEARHWTVALIRWTSIKCKSSLSRSYPSYKVATNGPVHWNIRLDLPYHRLFKRLHHDNTVMPSFVCQFPSLRYVASPEMTDFTCFRMLHALVRSSSVALAWDRPLGAEPWQIGDIHDGKNYQTTSHCGPSLVFILMSIPESW